MSIQLVSANIKNFKSLGDVKLDFRDLTILVGCNSSGKSNSLAALAFISSMLKVGSPPPTKLMQKFLKLGVQENLAFSITVKEKRKTAEYTVAVDLGAGKPFYSQETLFIGKTKVIDIKNGEGQVKDENGRNPQSYQSKAGNLALKSAGDFGDKPFTARLSEFIINWDFYDLDPELMRGSSIVIGSNIPIAQEYIPSLDRRGRKTQDVLQYWAENKPEKFELISQELDSCMGIKLKLVPEKEEKIVKVLEKDRLEVPLSNMSDGTLRIIAYYTLLYEDKLPTLIGIEEPERNLHPGILRDVASVVQRLSKKTQVIITTHSSQLLDCFNLEQINSDVSVILLSNRDGFGTQAFPIDELGESRDDLSEWMRDFGVGSAVYHSHLLQEILEK
jgi:predicted ATPase